MGSGETAETSRGRATPGAERGAAAATPSAPKSAAARFREVSAAAAVCLLAVFLRLFALNSDPYAKLSWSTGLVTDEGFYIHNARNVALFGVAQTDAFNNMWIMPTLHFLQIGVFRLFGTDATAARAISVACSLAACALLYFATRRAFGRQTAAYAGLLFSLDHVQALYNRLALMDTPAELLLVCALYAWSRAAPRESERWSAPWLWAVGLMLGLAAVTRGLAAVAFPAVLAVLFVGQRMGQAAAQERPTGDVGARRRYRALVPVLLGILTVALFYVPLWYLPHHAEIARVNGYYLWRQLLPATPQRLALNAGNAWFGDERGAAPFLMRHSPVQALLAVGWLIFRAAGGRREPSPGEAARGRAGEACELFAGLWLALWCLFLTVASYAPSRYFLLFYPALAILAALALRNLGRLMQALLASRPALFGVGAYCAYHAALSFWHHRTVSAMAAVGVATLLGGTAALFVDGYAGSLKRRTGLNGRYGAALALLIWAAINAGYLADWLRGLSFQQRDVSVRLARELPGNAVLIGDAAPGAALFNRMETVPVLVGLANDDRPLERYAAQPERLVLLDPPHPWWPAHYPALFRDSSRVEWTATVSGFRLKVYSVTTTALGAAHRAGSQRAIPPLAADDNYAKRHEH